MLILEPTKSLRMDQNVAVISKKIWHIVRVAIIMIKKGLCKKKILMELNMMMKRGKIAGKALKNIMLHHNHNRDLHYLFAPKGSVGDAREYEFSCSNTPFYQHYFTNKTKNHQKNIQCYMPSPLPLEDSKNINIKDVSNMLDMMLRNEEVTNGVVVASPGQGFGWSPAIRQLRITDSPFPVHNLEGDKHVDQDAENFIKNFYSQLKQQI